MLTGSRGDQYCLDVSHRVNRGRAGREIRGEREIAELTLGGATQRHDDVTKIPVSFLGPR